MRRCPTEIEGRARAIIAADQDEIQRFKADLAQGEHSVVLPVLFALRMMFRRTGPVDIVGDVAARGIEEQLKHKFPDAVLVGGLLALVALNRASELSKMICLCWPLGDYTPTVAFEAILAVRSVVEAT